MVNVFWPDSRPVAVRCMTSNISPMKLAVGSQLLVIGPDMPVRPWRSKAGQQRKQAISVALCRPLPAHLILWQMSPQI